MLEDVLVHNEHDDWHTWYGRKPLAGGDSQGMAVPWLRRILAVA